VVSLGAVALLLLLLFNSTAFRDSGANDLEGDIPSMTADQLRYFTSNFDDGDPYNPYWLTSTTEFLTRQFTPDGRYQMHNLRAGTAETSIYGAETVYRNMALGLTGRLEETSDRASAYGIVFRYLDEDNYNVFAVDGEGRYSIWVRVDGIWEELRNEAEAWTPHEAIHPIGEDNRLVLTVLANFITGYVNDQQVVRVTDSTLDAGRIGVYFATDSGEATVSVDSYEVYASVESMTSSRSQMGLSGPEASSEATAESSESTEPTSTRFSFLSAPGTADASDDPTATRSSFLSAPGIPRYTEESGTPLQRTPEPPAESSPYPEETALPDEE
jgi:hypothetical protein